MAIDPICGMTVDEATARSAERDGQTIYFCSEHCRQTFLGSQATEKPHPVHDHQMALERTRPTAQNQTVIYTCPMHPEIERVVRGQELYHFRGDGSVGNGLPCESRLQLARQRLIVGAVGDSVCRISVLERDWFWTDGRDGPGTTCR